MQYRVHRIRENKHYWPFDTKHKPSNW
jgi:hypothetical protein